MDNWRKSSYSGEGDGNECVEIASSPAYTHVSVRDSKAPAGATLTFPAGTFAAFVDVLKTTTGDR
ncbi:DUF397 domain-containing protein [Streptomyces sp. N50]|uniref:DUF397 domain-containing protein n=1 Tax=Streptomyces sp. N50 TaxID=3081765 RepID=UPI002962059E|nr:DUF397 domain-containing protein [Streptomyces sp. N50]WOX10202.1 DUF397 domain-containing protein [Streptomyces sp. N50]